MGWPQVVLLLMMVVAFLVKSYSLALDRDLSSGEAAAAIMFVLMWHLATAGLLHAGGFW